MKFPLVVWDNFYDNPDEIRDYALSLDFNKTGHFPGARSERIEDINYEMFKKMSLKFLSLVVEPENGVDSTVLTQFQKIDPMGRGLIHKDGMDSVVAGVVYLDPWPDLGSGTSFYRPIKDDVGALFSNTGCSLITSSKTSQTSGVSLSTNFLAALIVVASSRCSSFP